MATSSTPEDTIAECKRRIDECHTLSETTVVPEYRQALSAMAKAWMRIAQGEREHQAKQQATLNCLHGPRWRRVSRPALHVVHLASAGAIGTGRYNPRPVPGGSRARRQSLTRPYRPARGRRVLPQPGLRDGVLQRMLPSSIRVNLLSPRVGRLLIGALRNKITS